MDRRALCTSGLRLLLGLGLLRHAARAHALTGSLKWSARPWLRQLEAASSALSAGTLAPRAWQEESESILARLDLQDLRRSLDFEALAAAATFPARGEGTERLYFLDAGGRREPLHLRPFFFTLRKDAAVVPHGHRNMASLHLMLAGRARVMHFERLESSDSDMLIRPGADEVAAPGHVSSASDEHHNIHWFQALSDVYMFNIGVYQVRPGAPFGERDYVDPLGGTPAGNGIIRAPRLDRSRAYAKYGSA